MQAPAKYNFGFGEAVAVREVLGNFYTPRMGEHHSILSLRDMGYPGPGAGLPELLEQTKDIIKGETGLDYKHVLITAGAGQAILVVLHAANHDEGPLWVRFSTPYFSHYPSLAALADYTVFIRDHSPNMEDSFSPDVDIIDSPSNPEGVLRSGKLSPPRTLSIWDATYANRVYCKLAGVHPEHFVVVGSFGKLFGVNGIRLGWIATNDDYLFERMVGINYHLTLGVSVPSQRIMSSIIDGVDMNAFTREAALQIDCNREEMAKLEYLSSDASSVPVNGMFYWGRFDERARGVLKLAGVKWIEGNTCGGADDHLRLNLAQSRLLTRDMVKEVRKLDGKA